MDKRGTRAEPYAYLDLRNWVVRMPEVDSSSQINWRRGKCPRNLPLVKVREHVRKEGKTEELLGGEKFSVPYEAHETAPRRSLIPAGPRTTSSLLKQSAHPWDTLLFSRPPDDEGCSSFSRVCKNACSPPGRLDNFFSFENADQVGVRTRENGSRKRERGETFSIKLQQTASGRRGGLRGHVSLDIRMQISHF